MSSRFTKNIPEYIYFVGEGEWVSGPYVRPQRGLKNRKFRIEEVPMEVPLPPKPPMDRMLKDNEISGV
jgi:hypothetical protein